MPEKKKRAKPRVRDKDTVRFISAFRKSLGKALDNCDETMADVARDMRMHPSHLSRLVSGKTDPGVDVIVRLARRLKMNVEFPKFNRK